MFLNNSSEKAFGSEPTKSNICPECGEAQIFKWDNEGEDVPSISSILTVRVRSTSRRVVLLYLTV